MSSSQSLYFSTTEGVDQVSGPATGDGVGFAAEATLCRDGVSHKGVPCRMGEVGDGDGEDRERGRYGRGEGDAGLVGGGTESNTGGNGLLCSERLNSSRLRGGGRSTMASRS
jgi:hypothetical protein